MPALDLRPYAGRPRRHANGTPIPVRLAARIDYRDGDQCWEWMGGRSPLGYGYIDRKLVHRIVYELLVGPIPEGLSLDHLCRNPPCCNPNSRSCRACHRQRERDRKLARQAVS